MNLPPWLLAILLLALASCAGTKRPAIILGDAPVPHQAGHRFGWKGDDGRKPAPMAPRRLWKIATPAPAMNLSGACTEADDQGNIGSCVGHGVTRAWDMQHFAQTGEHLKLSRLMAYYNARAVEGSQGWDSGCQIVDAVHELSRLGDCLESRWPYDVKKFTKKPCDCLYQEALNHRVIRSYKVDNGDGKSIRLSLTNGFPVVFGALVYSGINDLRPGHDVLPMPRKGERPEGGHCMVIVGYDDATQRYLVLNSWGTGWGTNGYCWVAYGYIHSLRLTEDCWIIEEVMPTPAKPRVHLLAALFSP